MANNFGNESIKGAINYGDPNYELQAPSPNNLGLSMINNIFYLSCCNEKSIQYNATEKKLTLSVLLDFIEVKKRDYLPNMEIQEFSKKIIFKEVYTIENLSIKELVVLRSQLGEKNIKDGFYYIKIGAMYYILNYFREEKDNK